MKIAHIVSSFPPYYGGMGNVVFQTAEELRKRGHEVIVYTPSYENLGIESEDQVRRLEPSFRYGNAARLPQVERELNSFDLVHFHYPFFGTANIVRRWKNKNKDKPLVITYHMDPRGLGWQGLIFKLYARYYSHKILNIADKVIASSIDYVESSEAFSVMEENKDKWMGLPFGVDIDRFKPRDKKLSLFNKHQLNPDLPVLLFVGGMDKAHYFKGIPILLEALLILKKLDIEIQTLLVGGGELKEGFELGVKKYGLGKFVKFAGRVDDDELPYYYNLADLFVLPSIHQGEAFGMVLLEAMASGVPVVASDLPGVRTVASDGGILFETNNSHDLAETISKYFFLKPEEMQDWKNQARNIAETKYSWEKIVDQLEDVYNEFVL